MPDASNLALTRNAAAREENTIKYMSTSRYYVSRGIILSAPQYNILIDDDVCEVKDDLFGQRGDFAL